MLGAEISYICLNWNDAEAAQRPQQMCSVVCYSLFLVAFGLMGNTTSESNYSYLYSNFMYCTHKKDYTELVFLLFLENLNYDSCKLDFC